MIIMGRNKIEKDFCNIIFWDQAPDC